MGGVTGESSRIHVIWRRKWRNSACLCFIHKGRREVNTEGEEGRKVKKIRFRIIEKSKGIALFHIYLKLSIINITICVCTCLHTHIPMKLYYLRMECFPQGHRKYFRKHNIIHENAPIKVFLIWFLWPW